MKTRMLTLLLLAFNTVEAQVYECPAEHSKVGLTNAEIRIGARGAANALHGDVDQVAGGTNIYFFLPGDDPRWLVCQYGGRQVEGTAISGPRAIGGYESWIQLDPMTDACNLAIRESMPSSKERQIRTAAATCKRKEPPPPDLV